MSIANTTVIKSGKWEAGIAPKLGGNVVYLTYDGKDVLRPLKREEDLNVNPYLQGAPILLPANRTYLGKFSFEGVDYTLPITEPRTNSHLHGTVHRRAFNLIDSSDTSATVKYSNNGESYPFLFDLTAHYAIDDGGLTVTYTIKNTDTKTMPYTFCLHTTFPQPEKFSLPISLRQEDDEYDIPTGRYLELTEQEKKYVTGSPSKDVEVVGYFESNGNVAHIDDTVFTVSDNFDYWILYNARGKSDFLALEPQAGKVNGLNIDGGSRTLKSGESVVYTIRFSH